MGKRRSLGASTELYNRTRVQKGICITRKIETEKELNPAALFTSRVVGKRKDRGGLGVKVVQLKGLSAIGQRNSNRCLVSPLLTGLVEARVAQEHITDVLIPLRLSMLPRY